MIQVFSNSLGEEELAAVREVFASRWLGKGKQCAAFEAELAALWGSEEVLLHNCCTAAIYTLLRACGIGPGDEVIVPTINFVAIANAIIDLGARPVFADVDAEYLGITPEEIYRLKTTRTKAIFLLHYGGHPVAFDEIRAAAGDQVLIFEDGANAPLSRYRGTACGNLGQGGVFSFDAMKILVMGDGGALIVPDPEARARAKAIRYLGYAAETTSGVSASQQGRARWWEYELATTSGRFISNDILASIGRVQLTKLPQFVARRKEIWEIYQREFADLPGMICPPEPRRDTSGSYYFYWLRVPGARDALAHALLKREIYSTFRYYPLHLVTHYGAQTRLPIAEEANETVLNLPVHQNLSDRDVESVVDGVRAFALGSGGTVVDLQAANA